jgi:Ribonuclease G/E
VLRRIQREAALNPTLAQITVNVHPAVAQFLQQHEERTLPSMESKLDKKIVIKAGTDLAESQYEVTGVEAAA